MDLKHPCLAKIFLFKANNRKTRKMCENIFKVNNKNNFIIKFEHISLLFLVFLLLTLHKYMLAE